MSKFKECITNQNDIYVYFEIIKQVEPKRILDVGMFLKRIGAIGRQVADAVISREAYVKAVDFAEDIQVGVYDTVYDNKINVPEFMNQVAQHNDEHYDLAYMLYTESGLSKEQEQQVWRWLESHADYVVVDRAGFVRNSNIINRRRYKELNLEDKTYAIVMMR